MVDSNPKTQSGLPREVAVMCRWEGCESPKPTCKGCDGVSSRILCKGFSLLDSFSHAILSAAVKTHCPFTSLSGQFLFCKVTVTFCAIIYACYTFYLLILYNKLRFDFLSDHINLKFCGISTVDD